MQFEVVVRVRLNLKTLTLNLKPQSAVLLGGFRIRIRVSGPTFRTLFIVRVRVRVISGCDVIINMCTAVSIKL